MPVTTAPSVEAMTEIVSRVNSATTYTLPTAATRLDLLNEDLTDVTTLRVDVIQEDEEQMDDTLAVENRSTHQIRIVIRQAVSIDDQATIDGLRLLARQIWQRVNNHESSDGRVKVWEADMDPKEVPIRSVLRTSGVFMTSVLLRVEVGAS